jgi:geranylgeranylglycerol-phosphate geranylgeranyltransferase
MRTVAGFLHITRPGNALVCALSVFCGGLLGGKPFTLLGGAVHSLLGGEGIPLWLARVLFASLSAALVLAAGNVFNDVRDLRADRVNTPHRPLPSGLLSLRTATLYAAGLAFAGFLFAIPLGIPGMAVALAAILLLALYDVKLKGVPLAGNLLVALLGGLAFIYGGIAGGAVMPSLIPAVFSVLFHLGREIIKDAADVRGDTLAGIETVATLRGARTAAAVSALVFFLLAIAAALPAAGGRFGMGYLLVIALGVWPVLAYATASSLIHPSESNLRKVARILKFDMPVGVMAILAGFQGW